jgi:hypothetical protein
MHVLQAVQVWLKSVNNEGQFTWTPKKIFVAITPRIAVM